MIMKKGMVTLTALILLSGLLALILLFDEQIFAFFRAQMSQRIFHPDYTVGPGITPDQRLHQQPVAGLWQCHLPPVGNCTPP